MAMASTTYYYLTCKGKTDNQLFPQCPMVGPGRLGSEDDARNAAHSRGWVTDGKLDYCPSCKPHTPADTGHAAEETGAPRRPRRRKDTDPEPITDDGHNHEPQEQFA